MIQIQDDNSIQPVASVTNQAAQTTANSSPNAASNNDSIADNTAEIDRILAELDKLSKKAEENPTAAAPTVAADQNANDSNEQKDKSSTASTSDEKFDFDSFLSDLEAKIDQESNKNNSAKNEPMTDFPDSEKAWEPFRKNRSAADVQEESNSNDEPDSVVKSDVTQDETDSKIANDEELKSQNIFEMLGLANISDEEKNQFLDELEAMIWDDFIVHDIEILLSSEEYANARQILDDNTLEADKKKENLMIYLEKLIPDLDEVLYDKAIELKSEMMGERLNKLKENADQAKLAEIKKAEELIGQNLWKSATTVLNALN